jgi:hypothetical protein
MKTTHFTASVVRGTSSVFVSKMKGAELSVQATVAETQEVRIYHPNRFCRLRSLFKNTS